MSRILPEKTVERLSQYRRALMVIMKTGKTNIFSHELAQLIHLTSVQVRRDIMLIGYSGSLRKGYDIKELIIQIGKIIDDDSIKKVAIVGIGNLGRAFIGYLKGKRTKIAIVAAFDNNHEKVDKIYSGIECYHIDRLNEIIKKENISIGIITVPAEYAAETAEKLVMAGIKGILNYTAQPLNVSPHVYLEEYDMITSVEKVSYFVKKAK